MTAETWWAIVGKHQRRLDKHENVTPALYDDVLALRDVLDAWLRQMNANPALTRERSPGVSPEQQEGPNG